ncbi:MAG: DNA mismatch repair protein MutS, partial [Oscillospiraceae bacterium]
TSTFDGMSIARAVIEHIVDKKKLGAKTLFATHYHELTAIEEQLAGVKNYNIAVRKKGEDIIFLRRIVRGGADDSYGIYVSKLAGIPESVVNRAKKILEALESGQIITTAKDKQPKPENDEQMFFMQSDDSEIIKRLKELDVNSLSPIQALNILDELKRLV